MEIRLGREFRYQVMVVGVEPLGHLQRGFSGSVGAVDDTATANGYLARHSPRHCKIARKFRFLPGEAEARRFAAEQLNVGRHVIIEREIADRHEVQSCLPLPCPMPCPQFATCRLQVGGGNLSAPVLLQCELQLTLRAHARKSQGVEGDHGILLIQISHDPHFPCMMQTHVFHKIMNIIHDRAAPP